MIIIDANFVKENASIMVVMGNPPYGISGYNKSDYIQELTKTYKENLNEKNIQPLSDDYIKFIRLGENFIAKNKEGILAYVTNNSFLDGRIHRRMREHLLRTFDKIFIVNLHGDGRKEEAPDGLKDENMFNIVQGVCITIFVKTKQSENELAKVYYMDLFGSRAEKSYYLNTQMWNEDNFMEINPVQPLYFFAPKDLSLQSEYDKGFAINKVFLKYHSGLETKKDSLVIQFIKDVAQQIIKNFQTYNIEQLDNKYHVAKTGGWNYRDAKNDLIHHPVLANKVLYRPFDTRFTAYTGKQGFMQRPCYEIMKHFLLGKNVGLCTRKSLTSVNWRHIFVTSTIIDGNLERARTYIFPLYLYEESFGEISRRPNLNADTVRKFEFHIGLKFTEEKSSDENTFAPIDILDYIYGMLHSRKYRAKYNELLKIDFPKIPYPRNREYFLQIAVLGKQLRDLHLLNNVTYETSYPVAGSNIVSKPHLTNNRVYINSEQYFDGVSEDVWNFPIGGYIPAQKWLKDRKNRTLTAEDIFHYQKIIAALSATIVLMDKIDKIVLCSDDNQRNLLDGENYE